MNEIDSSFVESDRLERTEMICADIDPDDIDAHMEAERVGRRAALRECIVEGLRALEAERMPDAVGVH